MDLNLAVDVLSSQQASIKLRVNQEAERLERERVQHEKQKAAKLKAKSLKGDVRDKFLW